MTRLRQPTDQELRDLAMTLAGELDLSMSPLDAPHTRQEAANILAVIANRFSTSPPARYGTSNAPASYETYSDVVRTHRGQFNAWDSDKVSTTRENYRRNQTFWDGLVGDFFAGELVPTQPTATHYHAHYVSPPWSRSSEVTAHGPTGPHHFYTDNVARVGAAAPSYAMATFDGVVRNGPDPANDLNPQELAAFYPNPVPSPFSPRWDAPSPTPHPGTQPPQIGSSRNPFGVEGYEPPSGEVEVPLASSPLDPGFPTATIERDTLNFNDGMRSDPRGNYHNLTPEMQEMLATAMATLPQDLRDKVVITSTFRNDRFQNHLGDAIDIRNTNLSRQEEAQVAAAFARAGARGIGVYRNDRHFGDHMHIDRTAKFGAVHSRSTRDNPYLGPVYNAMRSGDTSRLSLDLAQMGLPTLPNPVARPSNLKGPPVSTFPARPSTPAALPAAPRRAETTPRLSERYAGSDSGSPVLPSTFPARPSMGTGGLPAARNDINGMRAQSEAIQRQTARPSVPTPRISRPATTQPRATRSPTDFQYATRAPTPPPAPRTPSPINAPQLGSQRGFFSSMAGADYTKPETPSVPDPVARPNLARAPSVPNPVPSPVSAPTVPPSPIARPSTLPQFGSVPNPVPRPNIPQFAGVPAPMPRSRFRQVPSPVAAPRRQQAPLLDLAGFNDFMGGIGRSIGSALSPMVTMTPAMRNAPTRYAGDVVLPPQPAGHPTRLTPPNRAGAPNDDNSFVRNLFTRQPTNPSLNGRSQGPWNSRGGEGGFVW